MRRREEENAAIAATAANWLARTEAMAMLSGAEDVADVAEDLTDSDHDDERRGLPVELERRAK